MFQGERLRYDLIVCSGKRSHRFLPEQTIDGAIVLDATFSDKELLKYADMGKKIVVLDRELDHPNVNHVLLDNKAGAALAMEYLWEMGHRRIFVVTGPKASCDSNQRLKAVRQFAERHDLEVKEFEGLFTKESGELAAERIYREYEEPAAVFCLNDEMAVGVYSFFRKTNLVIGRHIHIIGFDNIELAEYISPRLATIDYSKRKWGALASEQLLKMLGGKSVEHERIYVRLVPGESVGSLPNRR